MLITYKIINLKRKALVDRSHIISLLLSKYQSIANLFQAHTKQFAGKTNILKLVLKRRSLLTQYCIQKLPNTRSDLLPYHLFSIKMCIFADFHVEAKNYPHSSPFLIVKQDNKSCTLRSQALMEIAKSLESMQ